MYSVSKDNDFSSCPYKYWAKYIATDPGISQLVRQNQESPSLRNHDMVRRSVVYAVQHRIRTVDDAMGPQLRRFIEVHMPDVLAGRIIYFNEADTYATFRYRGISMAAQILLCVEYDDCVIEYRLKTGAWVDSGKDLAQACASACWYRSVMEHPIKPFIVRFCYLNERFNQSRNTISYQPTDMQVQEFSDRAYLVDYNIESCPRFVPTPSHDSCKFCPILSTCDHYDNFTVGQRFDPQSWLMPPPPTQGLDVFLSHESGIKETVVKPLARKLEAEGISYWLDAEHMGWGDPAASTITEALGRARYVIYFLNRAFFESGWARSEFFGPLHADRSPRRNFLPLIVSDHEYVRQHTALVGDVLFEQWDGNTLGALTGKLKRLLNR